SNNTIYGTQWHEFPETGKVPLIADMSSDIMSRPIDVSKFDMISADAQKNLGPSGVTIVIIKKDLLKQAHSNVPTMLRYQTLVDKNSLYNTPPTFGISMLGEVLNWIQDQGELNSITENNIRKANLIYKTIEESEGILIEHTQ